MRLIQYITEGNDKQFQWIKKNCSHILKHYEQANPQVILGFRREMTFEGLENALFRGAGGSHSVLIKKPRLRSRKPKDTPQAIHDLLNKVFKEEFGWPVRNGLPVTTSIGQTNQYIRDTGGQVYVVFPSNGFEVNYGKDVVDLWMKLNDMFEFDGDVEWPFNILPDSIFTTVDEEGFQGRLLKNAGVLGKPMNGENMTKYIEYEYGSSITQYIRDKFVNIKSTSKKIEDTLLDHRGELLLKCKQYALVTERVLEGLLLYLKWDEK